MVWIAIVLAAFLFYKFVERSHKVVFIKITCVCLAIGIIGGGATLLYNEFLENKINKPNISVEFSYHYSKLSKEQKQKIAERLFQSLIQSESYLISGLSKNELMVAKEVYFGPYIYLNNTINSVLYTDRNEFQSLIDSWSEDSKKSKEGLEKYNNLVSARLKKYIEELPKLREQYKTETGQKFYNILIFARHNSLEGEQQKSLEKALTKEEIENLHYIKSVVNEQADLIMEEFNKLKPDTEIGFKVCNKEKKPLNSYYFYVSGFIKGRSTPKPLKLGDYGESTRLEGDIIIPPMQCSDINWTEKYVMFDRYEIKSLNGTWSVD